MFEPCSRESPQHPSERCSAATLLFLGGLARGAFLIAKVFLISAELRIVGLAHFLEPDLLQASQFIGVCWISDKIVQGVRAPWSWSETSETVRWSAPPASSSKAPFRMSADT